MAFTFYRQLNKMDCGPACLRMVACHYKKHVDSTTLRQMAGFSKQGVSILGLSETARQLGFRTQGVQIDYEKLQTIELPAILHWDQRHFVVLLAITKSKVKIADPAVGILTYKKDSFCDHWLPNAGEFGGGSGVALLLEPTADFYADVLPQQNKMSWQLLRDNLKKNKWKVLVVILCLLAGMSLQLLFPILTQNMVDKGINARNIDYIVLVLVAQLMLTLSSTFIEFIRIRLQLKIANHTGLSILSDFWVKLTRLPLSYFDVHRTGDTMQRIGDNKLIQTFLSGQSITALFSILTFIIYTVILAMYNARLFIVFLTGNLLYFFWIKYFLKLRRKINYETFTLSTQENNATLQLVQGMQEIRLNNAEQLKRRDWEIIQGKVFLLNYDSLRYGQWQSAGALFITQVKDFIITYIVALSVINGNLTFGAMLAIQYIIGQLNGPIQQFITLSQSVQDAKISMERLNEVHNMPDEEPFNKHLPTDLGKKRSLQIQQLSFSYPGVGNEPILKNINLHIPQGKVTAIVGVSGSGKTTLLKLLLKIYMTYEGQIKVGDQDFAEISPSFWRKQCGAVLQDGYIFNDTIARNIALGDEFINTDRLNKSCTIANILSFIITLPNGFNTQLGTDGLGISQGQRQRLLIARAIYKNPDYLFLDEATNALDANNEKSIIENLHHYFVGRTVIVIAHRLSTVRNADNIIVLEKGQIIEEGPHNYLTSIKGKYFDLVKNQLELNS